MHPSVLQVCVTFLVRICTAYKTRFHILRTIKSSYLKTRLIRINLLQMSEKIYKARTSSAVLNRRTINWRQHVCDQTYLSPHDCAQTRLCPHTFVLRHVSAQTCLCPDTFVPTHVCAHKRLCPHTFVPSHVCAQTGLCPHTFVP